MTGTAVVSLSEMERMAIAIAKSNLFGIKTPDEALALMCIAQAEGLHPGIVARDYHIIQGRPTLKADAMLARFQQAGGTVEWGDYSDDKVSASFSHKASPKPVLIEWSIERASKITTWNREKNCYVALTDKENWINYPRQMLRARVISEGVRTTYPAASVGIYTPEEAQDMDPRDANAIEGTVESREDPRGPQHAGAPIATQPPEPVPAGQLPMPGVTYRGEPGQPAQQPTTMYGVPPQSTNTYPQREPYNPPPTHAPRPRVPPPITEPQLKMLINRATAKNVRPDDMQRYFGVRTLADLPKHRMDEALDYIARYPSEPFDQSIPH